MKMSSHSPSTSQPQLLTPQFFEQPPKLLPPSVFRQAITPASYKSEGHQESSATTCSASTSESAVADLTSSKEGYVQRDHLGESKTIKLCSESDPVQDSFNPKCDNQLLLVAENVSYSLAAKQRWKKSAGKVLEHSEEVTTPTIGQGHLDTPTLHLPESRSVPETASCRSLDTSTTSSVNDLPASNSVVSFPIPAFIEGRDLSDLDKPLISASSRVPYDYSCRNDLDQVYTGPAAKRLITDNLKLSQIESPSTELDTSSWSQSSRSSTSQSEVVSLTCRVPEDSYHLVDAGNTTVESVETMAAAAIDTESDHMLAQLLQNEEYGHASGARVPGQYVEQDVKRKMKNPTLDCSNDFEIARRLQQEVDTEVAHAIQRQEDHYPHRSGGGRRLGTSSDDDDVAHGSVGGYYDNNNQYCYRIREHVEYPDVHVGSRRSSTRRRVSSHHHRYHHAAVLGEDVDMSYEALVQLEDVSRGLDSDMISRLSNTYKYHPSSSTDKSCSVCLCEFESGDLLRSLPCIHAFHKNCIDKWLTENRHCPVCMKDIDSMK